MSPQRIRLSRARGWRKPEGAVVVSRPSRWGNPFALSASTQSVIGPPWADVRDNWGRVAASHITATYITSNNPQSLSVVVDYFRDLLAVRLRDETDQLRAWLAPLAGHDLACWCPLDQPCHADVLLELANPPHTAGCGLEQFGATPVHCAKCEHEGSAA